MPENKKTESTNHCYRAFGLTIASEIPLPELQPCSGKPDVMICLGRTPKDIDRALESNEHYQAGKNQLMLHVKNVGSYYIKNGSQITVEPAQSAEIKGIRLFLLGSAMGALLLQRGILPIHGSAIVVKEDCFIITGSQGAGKSTLAAAFKEKGYLILTDDIAAITLDKTGIPWVYPSYPQQKLWRDSLELMGHNIASFSNISGRFDKYAVEIRDGFCAIPKKLAGLYEVKKENCQEVSLSKLSGTDKLAVIMNNIYRLGFISGLDLKTEIFKYSAALVNQIDVSRIMRPDGVFTLREQINLIEKDLATILRSPIL